MRKSCIQYSHMSLSSHMVCPAGSLIRQYSSALHGIAGRNIMKYMEKYVQMTVLEPLALGHGMPKDSKAIVVIDRS